MPNHNEYPSAQTVITWIVRGIVGLFVLVLSWNVRSIVSDLSALQDSDRQQDRQIITLQVERRGDVEKLDQIDRKLEAIRQMLITGEIRVVTREVE